MTQNREPPAYQEYAATMLANKDFRLMSLEERGLLFTMRLECWQNKEVPTVASDLAKYLGCDFSAIQNALTPRVKSFFMQNDSSFFSPELEDYRCHLAQRRTKQSVGGKRGADKVNSKQKTSKTRVSTSDAAMPSSTPQLPRQGKGGFLVKSNPEKQSQTQSVENDPTHDTWINDYDRVSNGE